MTYEGWTDTLVSGWGTIESGGSISNTLKYVKVPPVSDSTCNAAESYNGEIISDQMICAGKEIRFIQRTWKSNSYQDLLLEVRMLVRVIVGAPSWQGLLVWMLDTLSLVWSALVKDVLQPTFMGFMRSSPTTLNGLPASLICQCRLISFHVASVKHLK